MTNQLTVKTADVTILHWCEDGRYFAKASRFNNKMKRPRHLFYYGFKTREAKDKYIIDFIDSMVKTKKSKEVRKATIKENIIKQAEQLQVGDIFYTSWGYDQTNVEFYQVVALRGRIADLKEIKQYYKEEGWSCGRTWPVKNEFLNDNIITRLFNGSFKIKDCQTAWKYDIKEKDGCYTSSYA